MIFTPVKSKGYIDVSSTVCLIIYRKSDVKARIQVRRALAELGLNKQKYIYSVDKRFLNRHIIQSEIEMIFAYNYGRVHMDVYT